MANREQKDIFQEEFLTDVRPTQEPIHTVEETDSENDIETVDTAEQKKKKPKRSLFGRKAKEVKEDNTTLDVEDGSFDNFNMENVNSNDTTDEPYEYNAEYDNYVEKDMDAEIGRAKKEGKVKKSLFGSSKKKQQKVIEKLPDSITIPDSDSYSDNLDGVSLEELEKEERVRQRRELAQAAVKLKKEDRKQFISTFTKAETMIYFAICTAASWAYMSWLSNLLLPSLLVSIVTGVWLTYWLQYKKTQLDIEQKELQDLSNFASQINFHMQNGKNVADTLEYIKDDYAGGRVGADIEFTFSKLMADGELITSNFERYDFTAFNVFSRNLQIAYHDGIDPKRLFKFPLNNINFEWVERNNLKLKNEAQRKQEFMSVAVSALIPASLRLAANRVYMDFLEQPEMAFILSAIVLLGMVMIITKIQKRALDVSVSL